MKTRQFRAAMGALVLAFSAAACGGSDAVSGPDNPGRVFEEFAGTHQVQSVLNVEVNGLPYFDAELGGTWAVTLEGTEGDFSALSTDDDGERTRLSGRAFSTRRFEVRTVDGASYAAYLTNLIEDFEFFEGVQCTRAGLAGRVLSGSFEARGFDASDTFSATCAVPEGAFRVTFRFDYVGVKRR